MKHTTAPQSTKVVFIFGTRVEQDLPEYPSGAGDRFFFSTIVEGKVTTYASALIVLQMCYQDFLLQAAAETLEVPHEFAPLCNDTIPRAWIPGCYLERPTIEVNNVELLLDTR